MNRNTLISAGIVGTAILGLIAWSHLSGGGLHAQVEVRSTSALSVSETKYDFGLIAMKNGNVDHVFTLTNATQNEIVLDRLSTSCMCTTAYVVDTGSQRGPFGMGGMGSGTRVNMPFSPGESKALRIVFDPNAHGPGGVGPMERFVHITDTSGGVMQLKITGTVRP